jgi:curved DNA-binding protein
MARDYYDVLGVNRNADAKELKSAFRKLAKQHHPDANPDDPAAETRFKEVNEAYEVLSDPEKRRAYDQFGPNFQNFSGFNGTRGNAANVNFEDVPFGDIFDSIFGNATRGQGRRGGGNTRFEYGPFGGNTSTAGRDIEHDITITLREAYEGTTRYITKDGRRIKVTIPAGANDGTKVRLSGEGEAGIGGGNPGDLYLITRVEGDNTFKRDADDLYVDVDVDAFTAMLGGSVRVPTMERDVKVKIAPGTQSGMKLRLSGKGMPRLKRKDEYGNLYAMVQITVPTSLTDEQLALVQQLKDSFEA